MSYSIVIPSRNVANLTACVTALRAAGEGSRVIVVWDGDKQRECRALLSADYGKCFTQWGERPFCFARNVNIGIRASGLDDVVLLNDDALLGPKLGGLGALSQMPKTCGIVGATTNVTGYPQQRQRGTDKRMFREVPVLAFVCVYIPRRTIDTVGLLDERFTTYGGDDVDYCLRVREAGLKVGVSDYCFVDHSKLPSTFRGAHPTNGAPGDISESNRLGIAKWGDKWPLGGSR